MPSIEILIFYSRISTSHLLPVSVVLRVVLDVAKFVELIALKMFICLWSVNFQQDKPLSFSFCRSGGEGGCVHVVGCVRPFLQPHGLQPTRFLCPCNFPGKNIGMGFHFLLQGILPTQGSNLCLLCFLDWQDNSLSRYHLEKPYC